VAHAERSDEDVHLTVILGIEEEKTLLAVEGIEGGVRLVPSIPKEGGNVTARPPRRDEVEVPVRAGELRGRLAGSAEPDRNAAEQAQRHAGLVGLVQKATALCNDVGLDGVCLLLLSLLEARILMPRRGLGLLKGAETPFGGRNERVRRPTLRP
jgi:hypothetical protein